MPSQLAHRLPHGFGLRLLVLVDIDIDRVARKAGADLRVWFNLKNRSPRTPKSLEVHGSEPYGCQRRADPPMKYVRVVERSCSPF